MIQNVLRSLGGIEVVGIISLFLFFLCFAGVLIWTFGLKRSYVDSMSSLPLDAATEPRAEPGPEAQPDSCHE